MHFQSDEPKWDLSAPRDVSGELTKPQQYASDLEEALRTIETVLAEQRDAAKEILRVTSGAKTNLVIDARESLKASVKSHVMTPAWDHLDKLKKVLLGYIEVEDF